ncbi:hypothetical protein [Streptomyces sp. SID10815]|uniref:hypothetical protein n=1 Tax=Streptomyces sp. SID10815 TaxID=2706027 RepID=UPI0013C9D970|nr:hypothetical protein [Streptomyces sp. SID10815]NEA52346.1 hypothetical protein [Streptomyces sp. SID10815]
MTARLSPEREAEIAARAEAAYPGPWSEWTSGEMCDRDGLFVASVALSHPATSVFIAHARTDVPALLAELAAVRAERDQAVARARKHGELAARRESELLTRRAQVAALQQEEERIETVRALCDAANHAGISSGGWFTVAAVRKALAAGSGEVR